MTNTHVPSESQAETRIYLPGVAGFFFGASPFLLLIGGFLARVQAHLTIDWAVTMTLIGTVGFFVGVGMLSIAVILVGVRSIAQQQVDILLRANR
ncbi:hypothetical protein BH10ACT7_BH10ACT7_08550 [soil metagenome]